MLINQLHGEGHVQLEDRSKLQNQMEKKDQLTSNSWLEYLPHFWTNPGGWRPWDFGGPKFERHPISALKGARRCARVPCFFSLFCVPSLLSLKVHLWSWVSFEVYQWLKSVSLKWVFLSTPITFIKTNATTHPQLQWKSWVYRKLPLYFVGEII